MSEDLRELCVCPHVGKKSLQETSVDGVVECFRSLHDTLLTEYGNQPRSRGATLGITILICWCERRPTEIQDWTGSEKDRGG